MDLVKRLEPVALLLMFIGAINWGIVALFDTDIVAEIFGTGTASDVVYVLVGLSALVYLPNVLSILHIGGNHPRPHGS